MNIDEHKLIDQALKTMGLYVICHDNYAYTYLLSTGRHVSSIAYNGFISVTGPIDVQSLSHIYYFFVYGSDVSQNIIDNIFFGKTIEEIQIMLDLMS